MSVQVEDFKRSLPTGIWIGADEHHAFEPVAVKRRRPKNSARVIDIFDDIFTREPIRQKVAPNRRGRVACDLVTPPAGDRDARPPAVFAAGSLFVAREGSHSTKRRRSERRRRRLGFGLTGNWIGERRDQRADPRVRRRFVGPMNRRENLTAWLAIGDDHAQARTRPIGVETRAKPPSSRQTVARPAVDLDERLRQMAREPRARRRCASWCATGRGCDRC